MKYKPELHKLSNGVPIILDPMDLETASFRITFYTGSRDEKPSEYGITHFCEHMFCKGSKRFPTAVARREYLADNGCTSNAHTSQSRLYFTGEAIADSLDILIDCIGEQLQNATFDKDTIERERGVILDELRRHDDNNRTLVQSFIYEKLFNHDFDHTLGTAENIKSFSRKQMLFFIRRRMSASKCVIVISGKILNKEKTLEQLEKSFNFLKPFDVKENDKEKYTPRCVHKLQKHNSNVRIEILFPTLWPYDNKHHFEQHCVQKFRNLLVDRIFDKLRSEHGLVYSVSSVSHGEMDSSVHGVSTQTAPENVAKCVALIAQTCADFYYNNSFSEQDVVRKQNRTKLADAKYMDSPEERSVDLEWHWRDFNELYDAPKIRKIGMSVTRDDIIKNTRGIFDSKMSIVTIGPKFDGNLMKIWHDNFKPSDNPTLEIVKQKKKTR